MNRSILLLGMMTLCASHLSRADEADCRTDAVQPAPVHGTVRWSGACKDGFAEGPGRLAWQAEGGAAAWIDGTLVRGVVQDTATLHVEDRFDYTGTLAAGLPDGQGSMRYALGGAVEGTFRAGQPQPGASITYAGSGYQGQVRQAGKAAPALVQTRYQQRERDPMLGTYLPTKLTYTSPLPANARWAALTPEQRASFSQLYPGLEQGDEPPYPLFGQAPLYEVALLAGARFGGHGTLRLHLMVGADGTVKEVTQLGTFDEGVTQYVAAAALRQRYKPALCRGQPCAMAFPVTIALQ